VLHVAREQRVPVLVDLTSAPGRTMVFTRTKHGAKALTRQLNRSGVPTVELHGNLSQGARTRNMDAFHAGRATTMVATDIAARGIHVDDIALVVHADPPTEHKAYLHRSGRTARAGAAGTVITLMTDEQVRDVRDLTRKAGIAPTVTKLAAGDALLSEVAPGERTYVEPPAKQEPTPRQSTRRPSRKPESAQRASAKGAQAKDSAGTRAGNGRAAGPGRRSSRRGRRRPAGQQAA
jgi:superfamily II DNA/RNA helicase